MKSGEPGAFSFFGQLLIESGYGGRNRIRDSLNRFYYQTKIKWFPNFVRSHSAVSHFAYCQVPVKRSCAPFVRVMVPVYPWPAIAFVAPVAVRSEVAAKSRSVVAEVVPDAPMAHVAAAENALLVPAHVIDTEAMAALPEPVLVTVRYGMVGLDVTQVKVVGAGADVKSAASSDVPVTATSAEFWPWEKMPKTKPPIATDAIRVTAMISTVAMMGEIAFLRPRINVRPICRIQYIRRVNM